MKTIENILANNFIRALVDNNDEEIIIRYRNYLQYTRENEKECNSQLQSVMMNAFAYHQSKKYLDI